VCYIVSSSIFHLDKRIHFVLTLWFVTAKVNPCLFHQAVFNGEMQLFVLCANIRSSQVSLKDKPHVDFTLFGIPLVIRD
jgi:hypothetical protein